MSAESLTERLLQARHRIVFAESCTAGLIAATLGKIPGVSAVLVGSAVVYQLATKCEWLNVSPQTLNDVGAVSQEVSEEMARGVLAITPHATIAASITGHLGPNAPEDLDGIAWSTVAVRRGDKINCQSRRLQLNVSLARQGTEAATTIRQLRQEMAAECVIEACLEVLNVE